MSSRLIELGFSKDEMYDIANSNRTTSERGFGILSNQLREGEVIVACWIRPPGGEARTLRITSILALEHVVMCTDLWNCTDLHFVAMPAAEAPKEREAPWDSHDLFGNQNNRR